MKSEGVTRRGILAGAAGLAGGLGSVSRTVAKGRRLDLSDPDDSLYAVVKLRGDVAGGRVLQWYTGELALLVPGRMPEPVASYQGVVRTDWTPRPDGAFDYRTFDLGYFGDPETGEAVDELTNPFTGEQVKPTLIEDGPIEFIYSSRGIYSEARGAPAPDRKFEIPWQRAGDRIWYTSSFGFEYPNPLPPAEYPELSATDTVVQRSRFIYRSRLSALEDASTRADAETHMLVVSTIHPWLRMGRHAGFQQIHTVSQKIDFVEETSPAWRSLMARVQPEFLTAETPFVGAGNSFERYKRERLPN